MATSSTAYLVRENMNHPSHGTQTGYAYGCRCPRCRRAHAKAAAERRARLGADAIKPLAADDPRHGTVTGYRNNRCRCDDCRKAGTADGLAYRKRRAAKNWAA